MSSTDDTESETKLVMVDGREAVAYVILRPTGTDGTVELEAATKGGVDQRQVAQALRHIADQWAGRAGLPGVLDEIAVQRGRQRTAAAPEEQVRPDGTGQYPETIDADVTQMACEQATEGGYLDWLHVVRAAAGQVYAENRPAEPRAALIALAAFTTGWIQAIDQRTRPPADGPSQPLHAAEQPPADGTGTPSGDR